MTEGGDVIGRKTNVRKECDKYRAIFRYLDTGQTPDSTQLVNLAFKFIRGTLDADKEKYEARCIRNSDNVKKRWKRDGCDEALNADQNIRNDTTDIPEDTTHIPNNATGIRNDTTDIPDGYQTPVITDNCKLITDNCVSTDVDTTCCTEPKSGSVQERGTIIASYEYRDDSGNLLAVKDRYALKFMSWRHPDGNGG